MSPVPAVLSTHELTVAYGAAVANDKVSIDVAPGQLVGLIGPNGAGKTTFIDAVTGFAQVTSGTVTLDGSDITSTPAFERARAGLRRTFQSIELFDDLTVFDNLIVASSDGTLSSSLADLVRPRRKTHSLDTVRWALEVTGIDDLADRLPRELSHGRRKLVGVARAIASQGKIVLLDEPASGLDTAESQALGVRLRALIDAGITILLVDHDMGLVLKVCDDIYVLDFGRVIAQGSPAEIRSDPRVTAAYLGAEAGEAQLRHGDAVAAAQHEISEARMNIEEKG